MRFIIHYFLHLLFPAIFALTIFKREWKKAWAIMIVTMLVDLDHLFASPLYDPNRCSIGFHPLHSYIAIILYCLGTFFPKTRIISVGLLFHMIVDYSDCLWIH